MGCVCQLENDDDGCVAGISSAPQTGGIEMPPISTESNAAMSVPHSSLLQLPLMSSEQHVPGNSAEQSGDVPAAQASPASITDEDCVPVTSLQQPGLIQSPWTSSDQQLPGTSAQQSGDNETTARPTTEPFPAVMGN